MGAVLSSEPGASAQGRAAATASQNPLSGLQGKGRAAPAGDGMRRRAAQDAQDVQGALHTLVPGSLSMAPKARASGAQPEGGGRTKAPSGPRTVGQREGPTLS